MLYLIQSFIKKIGAEFPPRNCTYRSVMDRQMDGYGKNIMSIQRSVGGDTIMCPLKDKGMKIK